MENVKGVSASHLATLIRAKTDQMLIIDSRTFCEYNTSHVVSSVNVWSSKIRKKRLQQNSMSVQDYLSSACEVRRCTDLTSQWSEITVYDQSSPSLHSIPKDSFLYVLLDKLSSVYRNVQLLIGGFLEFQSLYPDCCEDATQKCSPLTSLSQPCLPVANVGPTRILPFLYLGSQHDANNRQMLQDHCILYELNVSISCPKPDFVQESHFLRIPVNDNFNEKLLPYFWGAFNFIDKVRESGGSVLVHCLAGISRSATVAIAYVMKHLHLPYDEAYRYVKNRRPTISPNINFVGQLLELDRYLRKDGTVVDPSSAPATFRHNSPYSTSVSCASINNSPCSLEYAINSKLCTISDLPPTVTSSSYLTTDAVDGARHSTSSSAESSSLSKRLPSSQFGVPNNVSFTHVNKESDISVCRPSEPQTSPSVKSPTAYKVLTDASQNCQQVTKGLYSRAANISTHFGKGSSSLREDPRHNYPRMGGIIPRSLSLNLKSTLEAVPGSPGSTPQSPEDAAMRKSAEFGHELTQSDSSSPCTPELMFRSCESGDTLSSPVSSISKASSSFCQKPQFSSSMATSTASHSSSIKSLLSPNQDCHSPTIIEVRRSPTLMENVFDAQYSSACSDQKNNNKCTTFYSSTATISVAASDDKESNKNNRNENIRAHPRSVCIIEVNAGSPVTYVDESSAEPMIVRETEVYAVPSNSQTESREGCANTRAISQVETINNSNNNDNNRELDNNRNSNINRKLSINEMVNHKTLVPIRGSSSLGNIIDRPKVLELSAPIYNVKRTNLPVVLGDSSWQSKSINEDDECEKMDIKELTGSLSISKSSPSITTTSRFNSNKMSIVPSKYLDKAMQQTGSGVYDSEVASMADSSDYTDTASEFSIIQSDSGVSFQTDSGGDLHSVPIPRCYSSSETHLNTRRLLENNAAADYTTRKSCSNDEVAKNFAFLHKHLASSNSHQTVPSSRENNNTQTSSNYINWYHQGGELVRCDSWSTSGLGSELSDWESLQEDANSNHYDDAMGPFDAVFSDVFPGDRTDSFGGSYMKALPKLFKGEDDEPDIGECDNKKPRHNSFKDPQQRWRQQYKHIPLARPASLPGVMGTYLAQNKPSVDAGSCKETEGVELRGGGRGMTLQRASISSRDSGCGSSIRDSVSSSKAITSEAVSGVKRNDSGYYSVTENGKGMRSNTAPRVDASEQDQNCPPKALSMKSKKALMKPQSLAITPLLPLSLSNLSPLASPPPKCPSKSRNSPPKASIPTKCTTRISGLPQPKCQSANNRAMSPQHQQETSSPERSSPKSPASCGSPQPRVFGSSTFYLPQCDSSPSSSSPQQEGSSRAPFPSSSYSTSTSSQPTPLSPTDSRGSSSKNYKRSANFVTSNFKSGFSSEKAKSTVKTNESSKYSSSNSISKVLSTVRPNSPPNRSKSRSPRPSPSRTGLFDEKSHDKLASSSKCSSAGSGSSRETSIESNNSVILNKMSATKDSSERSSIGYSRLDDLVDSRHSRGNSEGKEKRRSCNLDSSLDEHYKKTVSLKTGVRLAQELLQSMENIVSAELSEIRRCTAELSSRYRLKSRCPTSDLPSSSSSDDRRPLTPLKHASHFYVIPDQQSPSLSRSGKHFNHLVGPPAGQRCHSEPPLAGNEGLYRVQSCPGLPNPLLVGNTEHHETVSELRPTGPPLMLLRRCNRAPPTREKLLNRYSCGALDAPKPPPSTPPMDVTFESCPDLGNWRGRPFTSDSSSSSMSSSRSSFSRLLPVS